MRRPTVDDTAMIPQIMAFFALDAPQEIAPVLQGISNRNYLVTTRSHAYVAKFIRAQTMDQIENDIAIQAQLLSGGVLTSQYILNPDGDYVFRRDDARVVVSERVGGAVPSRVSASLAFSMGRLLARFQALIRELPHPIVGWVRRWMLKTTSDAANALREADLPSGIAYLDLHPGNVHVLSEQPDRVYALFDFEDVGEDAYLVDLARSILSTCGTQTADGEQLVPEWVEAEVAGYESVRRLTTDERLLLPAAVRLSAEACIAWFVEQGHWRLIESHRSWAESFVSPF